MRTGKDGMKHCTCFALAVCSAEVSIINPGGLRVRAQSDMEVATISRQPIIYSKQPDTPHMRAQLT